MGFLFPHHPPPRQATQEFVLQTGNSKHWDKNQYVKIFLLPFLRFLPCMLASIH